MDIVDDIQTQRENYDLNIPQSKMSVESIKVNIGKVKYTTKSQKVFNQLPEQ